MKRHEERGSVELPVETLERYAGEYKGFLGVSEVNVDNGALVSVSSSLPPTRLTPTSDTEFYQVSPRGDLDVTFRVGADGTVEGADVKSSREGLILAEGFMERVD